jgi:hypothetical protein
VGSNLASAQFPRTRFGDFDFGLTLNERATTTTPVPILRFVDNQNADGSYTYGYESGDGTYKIETRYPTGEVKGKYGYYDDTGILREVEYGATPEGGFEPRADNLIEVSAPRPATTRPVAPPRTTPAPVTARPFIGPELPLPEQKAAPVQSGKFANFQERTVVRRRRPVNADPRRKESARAQAPVARAQPIRKAFPAVPEPRPARPAAPVVEQFRSALAAPVSAPVFAPAPADLPYNINTQTGTYSFSYSG